MFQKLIVLGASVHLAIPAIAASQEPPPPPPSDTAPPAPPSEELDEPATPPPAETTPPAAPPQAADPDEPPVVAAPTPPRDATLPRGGSPEQNRSYESPPPDRSGGTFELSLGAGITHVALDGGPSKSFGGLSGLNVGLGGWVSPRTALTLRVTGTSFVEPIQGVDVRFIAGLVGLSLQYMATNEVWVGAGIGIGVLTTDQDDIEPETGLGLDLRVGINLYQSAQSAVHLAVEITPGFFDGLDVTGIGFQLGWQSL
jgi:hypothetical protein